MSYLTTEWVTEDELDTQCLVRTMKTHPLAHDRRSWFTLSVQKKIRCDHHLYQEDGEVSHCPFRTALSWWGGVTLCKQECTPQTGHLSAARWTLADSLGLFSATRRTSTQCQLPVMLQKYMAVVV